MNDAENVAGKGFFDLEAVSFRQYHELPNGQGRPSQLHIVLGIKGAPHDFPMLVLRCKTRHGVEQLIEHLTKHRDAIWPVD